jgi:16S rRNA (guanine(1405)-N(7))-methyltransferase
MEELVNEIKKKKEISDIPDDLVSQVLQSYLASNPPAQKLLHNKKYQKSIIKEVRSKLRRFTGMFQSNSQNKKRIRLLEEENFKEILQTHTSTKERTAFYPKIRKLIFSKKPKSILDLGCGLNPLAIAKPKITYHCYDIKESELKIISQYFKKNKIKGKILTKDITKVKNFPRTDICLVFKILDILDIKGHEKAESLLSKIKSKNIIVSFPTKTLSGKPMSVICRTWFERLSERLDFKFKTLRFSNEIFYILKSIRKVSHQKKLGKQ